MDAFEVLGQLAALPAHPPVVVVAGEAGTGLGGTSLWSLGVFMVLPRPSHFSLVQLALRAAWEWRQATEEAPAAAGRQVT